MNSAPAYTMSGAKDLTKIRLRDIFSFYFLSTSREGVPPMVAWEADYGSQERLWISREKAQRQKESTADGSPSF